MMAWIGKWMIGVSVVHIVFGFAFMRGTLAILWSEGLWNTVNGQPPREATFWFLYTGCLLLLMGLAIDRLERLGQPIPRSICWGFVALAVAGAVIMPISGVWLLVPPAIGLMIAARRQTRDTL